MNPIFYLITIIIDFKIQFSVKMLTFLLIDLIFSKEFQELYLFDFRLILIQISVHVKWSDVACWKVNILPNHENKMPKPRLIYNFQIFNFRKIFKLWLTHILLKVHTYILWKLSNAPSLTFWESDFLLKVLCSSQSQSHIQDPFASLRN